jgi:hypothetical protein
MVTTAMDVRQNCGTILNFLTENPQEPNSRLVVVIVVVVGDDEDDLSDGIVS